jgi:hypothetical protein
MTLALSQRTCFRQPQPNLMRTFNTSAAIAYTSENREVGGSTPPLATTPTADQTPSGLLLRVSQGLPRFRLPTASDREYARSARSYRKSYRTKRVGNPPGAEAVGRPDQVRSQVLEKAESVRAEIERDAQTRYCRDLQR